MEREEQWSSLNQPLTGTSTCEGDVSSELINSERSIQEERTIGRKEVLEEVKKQLWLAGPLISVSFLQYCLQMISIMFVGHLGELSLAGASMATSFAIVTGFSLPVSHFLFFTILLHVYNISPYYSHL